MELYQLRSFLAVAEEGNLTRAAEKLFTSQPAVSSHVRMLEEELGVRLFERSARGMTLTPGGQLLQGEARRIVDAAKNFKHQAESLRGEVSGELVFGMNNSPDVLRLMPTLRALTDRHADLRYELVAGSSGIVLQGLDEGSISIGYFEGACTNARIASHVLTTLELCLVAPAAWREELMVPDWQALEKKPWIFVSPACSYFHMIEHIARTQGLHLQARFRSHEDFAAVNLVAEGLGITITSRQQAERFDDPERLFVLPHFRAAMPLSFGYLAARTDDPAIRAVRQAILEVWADTKPPQTAEPVFSFAENTPGRTTNKTQLTRRKRL